MKQCPACKTTYTDQTLRYCLADGSVLTDITDEESTVVRTIAMPFAEKTIELGAGGQMRVEIPTETSQTQPQVAFHPATPASGGSSGNVFKVLMVIIGLGIFAVIAVAAGVFIYFNVNPQQPVANNYIKPAASPTPARDDRDELRDQIANLEKLINEQKKTNKDANVPLKMPDQSTTRVPATVDSPGDGFLALRTLPSSDIGERILKIPHGAKVSVGACGPVVRPVSRAGRWCQASFNGYSGWVFDAYLVY